MRLKCRFGREHVHDIRTVTPRGLAYLRPLARGLARLYREEAGQSTLMITFLFGVLLFAFLAVGIDAGYIFREHRRIQSAADAAAVAAAEEMSNGTSYMQTAANNMAKLNGYDPTASINPAIVTVNNPPSTGNYGSGTNASKYVEVIITKPTQTAFLGFLNPAGSLMSVSARAVAGGAVTVSTCICLMNTSGDDLDLSNNASLTATKCGVTTDSTSSNSVNVANATLDALSLGMVSTTSPSVSGSGTITSTTKVVTGLSTGCSLTLAAPATPSTCNANPNSGWSGANLGSGNYQLPLSTDTISGTTVCYTSLDTSNMASLTFKSGYTYYIKGDFTPASGAKITGTGVSFYIGGNLNIANGVTVDLTAPYESDGVTPSTLFYVNGSTVSIQGGSGSDLQGLLYAPNAAVTIGNGTSTTLTMDVYAQTLTMNGGAVLNSYADSDLGSLSLGGSQLVE